MFRALATDPDDPNTLEGTIRYSFLEETKDSSIFSINSETGLITTKAILDREIQDKYTLVLVARDLGDVSQQSTKIFNVIVTDIDDNKPVFNRSVVSVHLICYHKLFIILLLLLKTNNLGRKTLNNGSRRRVAYRYLGWIYSSI